MKIIKEGEERRRDRDEGSNVAQLLVGAYLYFHSLQYRPQNREIIQILRYHKDRTNSRSWDRIHGRIEPASAGS